MSDPHPARPSRGSDRHAERHGGARHPAAQGGKGAWPAGERRSLFERLVEFLSPGPDSKHELISTLADAEQRELIEPESRKMLEGVLRMADLTAGDVMVAAPRMDLLDIDADYESLLGVVITTAHSRFPVYEGQRDNIIGILMAKDLLKLQRAPELNLRTLLRQVASDASLNSELLAVGNRAACWTQTGAYSRKGEAWPWEVTREVYFTFVDLSYRQHGS